MTDIQALEKRIRELEARVSRLEAGALSPAEVEDRQFMDALYEKARSHVVRERKASVFFLQRKLLIDIERATRLLTRLEADGVIGPATGSGAREVLVQE